MTRNHPRQEIEIVIDDVRMNHLRGDINQPRARLSQQQEQKQEALFVSLQLRTRAIKINRQRRYDDDRLLVLIK
jgi:hypothetical protein